MRIIPILLITILLLGSVFALSTSNFGNVVVKGWFNQTGLEFIHNGSVVITVGNVTFDGTLFHADFNSNRIGIGTINPTTLLHVQGTNSAEIAKFEDNTNPSIVIKNSDTGITNGENVAFLNFQAFTGDGTGSGTNVENYGQIFVLATDVTGGTEDASMVFSIQRAGALTEAMRILSDGKVGIGTTTPGEKLEVNSGTDNLIALFNSTDDSGRIAIADDDTIGFFGAGTSLAYFGLTEGINSLNLNINGSGFVGIGTTSPRDRLDVKGAGGAGIVVESFTPHLDFIDTSTSVTDFRLILDQHDFKIQGDAGEDGTFEKTYMTILGDSNFIGIGTTSPGASLDILDSGATETVKEILRLRYETNTTAGVGGKITFTNQNGVEIGNFESVIEDGNNVGLAFGTFATSMKDNRLVILANGNVGIGVTDPDVPLEVIGNFKVGNGVLFVDDGSNEVGIGTTDPRGKLHIITGGSLLTPNSGANELVVQSSGNGGITIFSGNTSQGVIFFADEQNAFRGQIAYQHSDDSFQFTSGQTNNKLVMAGTTTSAGGNHLCYDGSGVSTWGECTSLTETKTNINELIFNQNFMNKYMSLRPVTYNWKDLGWTQEIQIGFLAEEVEAVHPSLAQYSTNFNETLNQSITKLSGVKYDAVSTVNVLMIQELVNRNIQLNNELVTTRADLQTLKLAFCRNNPEDIYCGQ